MGIRADAVVLSAGALATPVLLQNSGVTEAGHGLFVDMFINMYGITDGINQLNEPTMALIHRELQESQGFILSPFINHWKVCRYAELGARGLTVPLDRMIGMMIKIQDEPTGRVFPDGTVSKGVTAVDRGKLREGSRVAGEILIKAGADRQSVITSIPQGPHPGGTAAIGTVVDSELRTEIENLFVCDGSVLPTAPGLPPIVTIVALAKRLARTLAS